MRDMQERLDATSADRDAARREAAERGGELSVARAEAEALRAELETRSAELAEKVRVLLWSCGGNEGYGQRLLGRAVGMVGSVLPLDIDPV